MPILASLSAPTVLAPALALQPFTVDRKLSFTFHKD